MTTKQERASEIKYIVIHCTAGHTSADKVQAYFLRSRSKGGRGWSTGGYHRIIEKDGTIKKIYPLEKVTNGVRGFNVESIHISYVGGVDPNDHTKALDTRTEAQKSSIERCIVEAINWLREQGRDVSKDLMVLGHREFSADQNRNGVIEAWERIKECPSFDAMFEYNAVFGSANNKLPHNR